MDTQLSDEAQQLSDALRVWAKPSDRVPLGSGFSRDRWEDFIRWGLVDGQVSTLAERVAGFTASARNGLVGPVLEAEMALVSATGSDVADHLERGAVVTSVLPGRAGPAIVGWGAVAEVVVDQSNGAVVASSALPEVEMAYPAPHGWYDRTEDTAADQLRAHRWVVGAALLVGLVDGALEMTSTHVKNRHQFGRPLATFQAIQFPLAECKVLADGAELCSHDAAVRLSAGAREADVAAALAWLVACRAARKVTQVCQQSYGAMGFCLESGLPDLTWGMSWLRLGVGPKEAQAFLASRRRTARLTDTRDPSACLVLEGFGVQQLAPVGSPIAERS